MLPVICVVCFLVFGILMYHQLTVYFVPSILYCACSTIARRPTRPVQGAASKSSNNVVSYFCIYFAVLVVLWGSYKSKVYILLLFALQVLALRQQCTLDAGRILQLQDMISSLRLELNSEVQFKQSYSQRGSEISNAQEQGMRAILSLQARDKYISARASTSSISIHAMKNIRQQKTNYWSTLLKTGLIYPV